MAKKEKKNGYYYAFIAIILIIAIIICLLDYNFRLGLINWDDVLQTNGSNDGSPEESVKVDKVGNLVVTFIDVGQGDAILIEFPDGKNMLVDAGNDTKAVEKALDKHLTRNGKKLTLHYVVSTHSDADHIGSMDYVYANYEVLKSYRPYTRYTDKNALNFPVGFNIGKSEKNSITYYEYLENLRKENDNWEFFTDKSEISCTVSDGNQSYPYSVDFVMPYAQVTSDFDVFKDDVNEVSSIFTVEFAGFKILFTGDIEGDAERLFVKYFNENESEKSLIDCDLLKVAHHGSYTSSSSDFLELVNCEYSVISCGIDNKYNHPNTTALERIISSTTVYRTDLQGDIVLTVTPNGDKYFTTQINEFDGYRLYSADELEEMDREEKERGEKGIIDKVKEYKENLQ